ncbi:MAG: hypothetical protein WBJ56_02530 [Dethiobacteria bacterium]
MSDSFQRPILFLPSLDKKSVIVFYHVVIWVLIVSIAIIATGVTTYDQIKIIHWITIFVGALLFPLFLNSHPRELPEKEMKRAILSIVVSFGILGMVILIALILKVL